MSTNDGAEYEAVVGKCWDYYRPRFERFERGGWLSWNWAACFGTLAWLRYRRLHAWSWAYFFVSTPVLLSLLLVHTVGGDSCEKALAPAPGHVTGLPILALVAAGWLLPPLFANRLYYNHVRNRVGNTDGAAGACGYIGTPSLQAAACTYRIALGPGAADQSSEHATRSPRMSWARLLWRVFGILEEAAKSDSASQAGGAALPRSRS